MKPFRFLADNLISAISLILMIGVMGTRPLVSLLANDLGASPLEIGIIVGIYPLLPFFFAIKIGQYVDRIGPKLPIIVSTFLCSLSLMIPLFSDQLLGLYLSQFFGGLLHTIFLISAQTLVSGQETDGEAERDKNIMKFSIGMALGSFIGPLLGGVIAENAGYHYAFGVLGGVGLLSTLLAFYLPAACTKSAKNGAAKKKVWQSIGLLKSVNIRKAFMISILILLGKDIYTAYFPLLALEFGLNDQQIGAAVAINAAAGILIRWSIPKLLKSFNKNRVIVFSILFSGICMIALPFFPNWAMLSAISFLLGLGLGIGQPLSISATILYLPDDRIGEGLGLRLTANRLTQALAPMAFGAVAEVTAMSGVFWISGAILLFGSKATDIGPAKPIP
ncbi:MFS transporter [Planomicrobium sp. CPCC 101079]|uniref:MFS transporter n=1 Tax=Planomicrobium sp. CPCC 101079 TaxID=2599618 RepID=UPI0016490D65|nr:MFS transporter [Planomicrobium sp. CPCC 101079]